MLFKAKRPKVQTMLQNDHQLASKTWRCLGFSSSILSSNQSGSTFLDRPDKESVFCLPEEKLPQSHSYTKLVTAQGHKALLRSMLTKNNRASSSDHSSNNSNSFKKLNGSDDFGEENEDSVGRENP